MEPPSTTPTPPGPPPEPQFPDPFRPGPLSPQVKAGGCGRVALIGCGVMMLLLGVAALVLVWKATDLLVWTLGMMQQQVEANLPEELSEGDRERLHQGFDRFYEAVRNGEVEPQALQQLQRELLRIAQKPGGSLSRDEVRSLIRALEEAAGHSHPKEGEAHRGSAELPATIIPLSAPSA